MFPQHKQNGSDLIATLQTLEIPLLAHRPCSWLEGITCHLRPGAAPAGFAAVRADHAVAAAGGAWLGGKLGAVCLPSTELASATPALQGLLQVHGIPCVLLISWRGEGGAAGAAGAGGRVVDSPDTHRAGETLLAWLDVCNVRRRVLERDSLVADVTWAARTSRDSRQPTAVIVRKGVFGA
jgi:sulfopyruvate decarboxylase subunit alpha